MKYFSLFRFDETAGLLFHVGRPVPLTRKAGDLLRCLIDGAGTVIPHSAILSTVWQDTHVQPENVKVLVRELRRYLGDDAQCPRFIRNEPGCGYAFMPPVADSPLPGGESDRSGIPPVLVNRSEELNRLRECLSAAADSTCQLVLLEGDRGMGKTALCDAFFQLAARTPAVRAAYAQCVEQVGLGEQYLPVLETLNQLASQCPADLPQALEQCAPKWHGLLLQQTRGSRQHSTDAPAGRPPQMVRELKALLEHYSKTFTAVLVLEDLQWADAETVELLHALSRHHAPSRSLIVATYSPFSRTRSCVAMGQLAGELQAARTGTVVRLRSLSENDVRAVLQTELGEESAAALTAVVYQLSGGHPSCVGSAVKGLMNARRINHGSDEPPADHMARMQQVLERSHADALRWRIDQLHPSDRALLAAAVDSETSLSATDLASRWGVEPPDRTEARLDQLASRGFLARCGKAGSRTARYRVIHHRFARLWIGQNGPMERQGTPPARLSAGSGSPDSASRRFAGHHLQRSV
jgi:DNA-binding winged helix-turn-helix (wHTH) protein